MTTRKKEDTILAAKIEIVKTIFEQKQNEKAARKAKAEQQIQRKKILQALAEQNENALKSKSPEELMAMLKDLDTDEE
jgi:sRNA-binding carbon storage regulator CsrA